MTTRRLGTSDEQAETAKHLAVRTSTGSDYFEHMIDEAAVVITLDGGTPNDDMSDLVTADLIRLRKMVEEARR